MIVSCIVARDRGRWCARLLDRRQCGTSWLALDGEDVIEALARAAYVFEGCARRFEVLDVTEWAPVTREGIETARTLDDLITAPPWIRAAVLAELRAERAKR